MEPGVLAVLSGVVTGLIGGVAYFLVPLATSEYVNTVSRDSFEITLYIFEYFFAQSLFYHVGVLVLVPLVTTAVALSLARRSGHVGRSTAVAVMATVVVGPVIMVWLGMIVALVAIAAQQLYVALFGFTIALSIAIVFSIFVATITAVSAVGGYALVEQFGARPPE
ncbi:hypothetical protein RBH20_19920 [Haloarcula sp. H-GB4]|uniref:hypothetical protein n=1 Tax=Haloarcula sp. H-GB4 TaxID=3069755 RepID=UPI0027B0A120|nr:hypothetical protein [Haloarcula sp. H-GB4]MDQ2074797.1 hypothetical protein [Haloarcula sp. H-GB4]